MRLATRTRKLEARIRAEREAAAWFAGLDPNGPEAQAWLEARYDGDGWYATLTDAELATMDRLEGVDPAEMGADDREAIAIITGRLNAFRRPGSPPRMRR